MVGGSQEYNPVPASHCQRSGMHLTSPYHSVDTTPNMNGYPPEYYAADATSALPTYLTSINYPTIYGSYGYQYAPGRFTYGAALMHADHSGTQVR
jgi:hypothetical protein